MKKRLNKICQSCGKIFFNVKYRKRFLSSRTKYCSHECSYEQLRMLHVGHKVSEQTRMKISKRNSGKRNGQWKGGYHPHTLRKENYKKFLESKELTDLQNYPCEICGKRNNWIYDLHHIISRTEAPRHKNLHDLRNLIYICRECHSKIHLTRRALRVPLVKQRNLVELFPELSRKLNYEIKKYYESQ